MKEITAFLTSAIEATNDAKRLINNAPDNSRVKDTFLELAQKLDNDAWALKEDIEQFLLEERDG